MTQFTAIQMSSPSQYILKPQNQNKNVCVTNKKEKVNKVHILVRKNPGKAMIKTVFSYLYLCI